MLGSLMMLASGVFASAPSSRRSSATARSPSSSGIAPGCVPPARCRASPRRRRRCAHRPARSAGTGGGQERGFVGEVWRIWDMGSGRVRGSRHCRPSRARAKRAPWAQSGACARYAAAPASAQAEGSPPCRCACRSLVPPCCRSPAPMPRATAAPPPHRRPARRPSIASSISGWAAGTSPVAPSWTPWSAATRSPGQQWLRAAEHWVNSSGQDGHSLNAYDAAVGAVDPVLDRQRRRGPFAWPAA